ncbi:MAG: TIM barrel protein, partial [candidate division KSB1 bacterium]|nr:TIM barrel protein [candidate division KSB1 bacterium]
MRVDRRTFLKASAVAGLSSVLPGLGRAMEIPDPPRKAVLRLSCQESVAPGRNLQEKLDQLEKWGFEGIEPHGRGLAERLGEYQAALRGRKIRVSAVCAGYEGVPISADPQERERARQSIKRLLEVAGALGATGLIVVPAFLRHESLPHHEARRFLVEDFLPDVGAHAAQHGTRVLLEPLNRREAYFLRLVADAAALCRDSGSPGVACMGDFWHMTWEETSDMGAFISAGDYLHHVHMASRKHRNMPGEDEGDDYVLGFRGLKIIGYQDFVS